MFARLPRQAAARRGWSGLGWALGMVLFCAIHAVPAWAIEEPELFLAELRARGYFDTAIEYIDSIAQTDLVSEDFKKSIPYEKAILLAAQASTVPDAKQRDAILKEAIDSFKTFAEDQPNHEKALDVRMQISNVYLAMGMAKLQEAARPNADAKGLNSEARTLITAALDEAVAAEKVIQEERIPLEKKKPKEEKLIARRDYLRVAWLRSELLQATLQYELAATHKPGSKEHQQQLEKARAEFAKLAEKHSGRSAGLIARLREAQCLVELKQHEKALNALVDFIDLPDNPPQLREMKLEAVRYGMEASIGLGKLDDALNKSGIQLRSHEKNLPQGQAVLYFEAVARKAKADAAPDDPQSESEREEATKLAEALVKKASGQWQSRARELLVELGGQVEAPKEKPPETFGEAIQQANTALQQRKLLAAQLDKADEEQKPEIQKKIDEQLGKAFDLYQTAVALADHETPLLKLAQVHKAICYLFWDRGDHLRAAVVGDYLARQFPKDENGKFGSWIAFNAWMVEYNKVSNDRSYEIEQMRRFGRNIIQRWPDSSEAIASRFQLMNFAIRDGEIDEALDHLNAIP
ncbi:MAG: hypothetical protein GTO62_20160, partial [Planctomycetales bacterium]|nr:hypothetical protein [Planctomycetales bacterium]